MDKMFNTESFVKELYRRGRLEASKLVDYENKKYDIAVLLYKDINDDYIVLDYVYGAEDYRNELEVLIDNSNIVVNKLMVKLLEGKTC